LQRINWAIDLCLKFFVGLSLGLLVTITFAQVFGRYVLGYSFGWAEELCVLIFCWAVWPTACLLLRDCRHLHVSLIINRFSDRSRLLIGRVLAIVLLVFMCLVVYAGWGAMDAMAGISFVDLPLPINVKFSSVPLGAALMAYYMVRDMLDRSEGKKRGNC
jgi:TRAP-type C4-dicarboxylate transport system permease small subunit